MVSRASGLRQTSPSAILLALVALGIVLRASWTAYYGDGLEGNGCEYARIAENLFNRGAYVGLFEGPELMFPPFYPIALTLAAVVAGSVDYALRLVPLGAGVLLVPVAFALGQLVYGARVGLIFAALIAVHPLLVELSSTGYSETVYLPLVAGALYWALRSLRDRQWTLAALGGAMFGLAALTRPEAFIGVLGVLVAALVWRLPGLSRAKTAAHYALWMLVPFALIVSPYVAYLSLQTGNLRLEGKALMNYTISERRNAGMNYVQASLGIGPDLSEQGPMLSPNHFVLTTHRRFSVREIVIYWLTSARRNGVTLWEVLVSSAFGSFLALGLVVVGLFGRPWSRSRAVDETALLGVTGGTLVLLLGMHSVVLRYALPLLIISLLWVSKGIDEVARWAVGTARRTRARRDSMSSRLGGAIRCFLIVGILLLAFREVRWDPLQVRGADAAEFKKIGTWLSHYQPGPKRVMTIHPEVAYYSGGTYLPLPYTESSAGLRYVRLKRPDFIVLIGEQRPMIPYLGQWLEQGIPDEAARLIYEAPGTAPGTVAIYEWQAAPAEGR